MRYAALAWCAVYMLGCAGGLLVVEGQTITCHGAGYAAIAPYPGSPAADITAHVVAYANKEGASGTDSPATIVVVDGEAKVSCEPGWNSVTFVWEK